MGREPPSLPPREISLQGIKTEEGRRLRRSREVYLERKEEDEEGCKSPLFLLLAPLARPPPGCVAGRNPFHILSFSW